MTQATLSTIWAVSQLAKLSRQQPELVETAVNQLLQANPELNWSLVVNAYLEEEINLGKAAELLGMHELELRQRFIELGIPLRLGVQTKAEAAAEIQALESWLSA